jgi:hypothetical protein
LSQSCLFSFLFIIQVLREASKKTGHFPLRFETFCAILYETLFCKINWYWVCFQSNFLGTSSFSACCWLTILPIQAQCASQVIVHRIWGKILVKGKEPTETKSLVSLEDAGTPLLDGYPELWPSHGQTFLPFRDDPRVREEKPSFIM